jgi:hypothetical protein
MTNHLRASAQGCQRARQNLGADPGMMLLVRLSVLPMRVLVETEVHVTRLVETLIT